jgi:SAM-dependent methyltransferase
MEVKRKPFQGVLQIIRFNPFFFLGGLLFLLLTFVLLYPFSHYIPIFSPYPLAITLARIAWWVGAVVFVLPIVVSWYVYDNSPLYQLPWLKNTNANLSVLNIHAGFDETSLLIQEKIKPSHFTVADFYNPQVHTEPSIRRARLFLPPLPETIAVSPENLPFENDQFDLCLVIFSAHEIRNTKQQISFFEELKRVTKANGKIMVTEHLKDGWNTAAYTFGVGHFFSFKSWKKTFEKANLIIEKKEKTTVFITTFTLRQKD